MAELQGCIFPVADGYWDKYFKNKKWSFRASEFADLISQLAKSPGCVGYDTWDSQQSVTKWFMRLKRQMEPQTLSGFRVQQRSGPGQADGTRLEVLFTPFARREQVPPIVRVFGEVVLGSTGRPPHQGLGHFLKRGIKVFNSSPTRHFLHGFRIYRDQLELWTFDRSGVYSSGPLHWDKHNPTFLAKTMAAYAMMDDVEVGLSPFQQTDVAGDSTGYFYLYFPIGQPVAGWTRYYIQDCLFEPHSLLGRGTSCYLASRSIPKPNQGGGGRERRERSAEDGEEDEEEEDAVVKFAWRDDPVHKELVLLRVAEERGAQDVARVRNWRDLVETQKLRAGLKFTQPHSLTDDGNALTPTPPPEAAWKMGKPFINRTLSVLVTQPHGRPIYQFASIPELLEACQDVVRAHESLYRTAGILQRDLSVRYISIPDYPHEIDSDEERSDSDQDESGTHKKGLLIDLDLAHDLLESPTKPGSRTGSLGCMAIGVLSKDAHTYRHDLESLFYVFLWLAVGDNAERMDPEIWLKVRKPASRLLGWVPENNHAAAAENKKVDMSVEGFERILEEFSVDFAWLKGLARELRRILFPEKDGELWFGTNMGPAGTARLYNEMAGAFERAAAFFE